MIKLIHGDCLELMKDIPDKSIDMILCDLPYGTTACKWDVVIPFEPLWEQYNRIIKDKGAIVLFGSEPFASYLRMSNIKNYKYDWIWEKSSATGHLNAKKQPMRAHEIILVFYNRQTKYNPQKTKEHHRKVSSAEHKRNSHKTTIYNEHGLTSYDSTERYPRTVLQFPTDKQKTAIHPTQKPVALLEYLIKTYTIECETVLDNTMGSGSTGVACKNLNRSFIGIEKDDKYFNIAQNRIENHKKEPRK